MHRSATPRWRAAAVLATLVACTARWEFVAGAVKVGAAEVGTVSVSASTVSGIHQDRAHPHGSASHPRSAAPPLAWTCPSPAPPAPPTAPPPFPSADFVPHSYGTFCCDQTPCSGGHSSFLFQGAGVSPAACAAKCLSAYTPDVCRFITTTTVGAPYCMNAQFCNTTVRA